MGVFDTPTGKIGAVQAGAGAIMGAANQIAAGVHAKQARNQLKASDAFNENMFNKQYYQDMMDRSEVQSALNLQRKNDAMQAQQDAAQAAVMGATPEVQAAMQQQRNQGMANTIAQIAANTSAYKDAILGNYQNAKNNYFNAMGNSYMNQSQQETNAAAQGWKMAADGAGTIVKGLVG
jgi:hypothetical protein